MMTDLKQLLHPETIQVTGLKSGREIIEKDMESGCTIRIGGRR